MEQKYEYSYIYYKQARALRQDIINAINGGAFEACNSFVRRYDKLKEHIQDKFLNRMSYTLSSSFDNLYLSLPEVHVINSYSYHSQNDMLAKMYEVMTATGQMLALLEGIEGPNKKIETLEKDVAKLRKELKNTKMLMPQEVIIKLPTIIQKTVNEANSTYNSGNHTATAMLLRKIVENSLRLKCKMNGEENKLQNPDTKQQYELPKKIDICAGIGIINHNLAKQLKNVKLYGDFAVHSLNVEINPQDIEDSRTITRLFLEEIFTQN